MEMIFIFAGSRCKNKLSFSPLASNQNQSFRGGFAFSPEPSPYPGHQEPAPLGDGIAYGFAFIPAVVAAVKPVSQIQIPDPKRYFPMLADGPVIQGNRQDRPLFLDNADRARQGLGFGPFHIRFISQVMDVLSICLNPDPSLSDSSATAPSKTNPGGALKMGYFVRGRARPDEAGGQKSRF
ncbi:MAG: hypothetical protein LBU64_13625 [Planctomycetota bacterium]|jgi:hypothetical protein|nr:hypothetical protein [Planctomycetota bacterium]